MAQIDEIKKILRSLLVSAPVKVTVFSLNRDFKSLEGYYIPFKQLGYNSLLHLLHSIPDVLRVNGSSFDSEVTLVITEKVAHVNDMVMKQKRPTKGKNAFAGRKSFIQSTIKGPSNRINVSSFKSGAIKKIQNNIRCETGKSSLSINYLKGVNELSPFPRSFPNNFSGPSFTKHSQQRVQENELNFHENSTEAVNSFSNSKEDNFSISIACEDDMNSHLPKKLISPNCERVPSVVNHMPHNTHIKEIDVDKEYSKIQSNFQKLKISRLKNKHTEDFSENRTVRTKNETSPFNYHTIEGGGIITFENESSKVPIEIQNRLRKLIKFYSSGIRCTDLPSLYRKMFRRNLEYQTYGFNRLINLCIHLDSIFYCEEESDCDFKLYDKDNPPVQEVQMNEKLNGSNRSDIITRTIDISQIKAVKSRDWDIHIDCIPEDILELGEIVNSNSLNEYVVNDTFQIVISEICDPSKFWIYKNDGHLDEMMNSMQNFYKENKSKYLIPEFLIEVGLYCVVYTLNEFQRSVVVDLLQDVGGHVRVYLIDFGTMTNLSREKIWFLSKEFCTLPAQAVEAKLAGIEPKDGDVWTKQSIVRFKNMVVSKYIFAKILDKKDQILSVDVSAMNIPLRTLNDLLVQEEYAKYTPNCDLQDSTASNDDIAIAETNPRKKFIDRIRCKNMMKQ